MQTRNDPSTKMANDRSPSSFSASRPRTLPIVTRAPGFGDLQRPRRRLEAERADEEAGHDPADRPEDADRRELAARILHLAERQRVAQRERRHVAQRVDEQHEIERP